ncbi:MAG: T9SS type A sorting domain-containing protein, partial [Muribaculaceae bacterium]
KANEMNIVDLPTSDWCDAKDRSNYPIQLVYIYFEMGPSVVGTEYSIEIPGIEAVYNNVDASGVEDVFDVSSSIKMYPNPVTLGESVNINLLEAGSSVISIYNEAGQLLSKETNSGDGNISLSTSNLYRGIFFVNVMQNSSTKVLKLIIK